MTDMKRSTISFPDDVMEKIKEIRKLPENKGKPFSKVIIQLIRTALDADKKEAAT